MDHRVGHGGGCVEAEVKRRALALIPGGQPELMSFQLDSDYGWDDGLICGGRMRMLVDPVRGGDISYYRELARLVIDGRGCTEAVVLDTSASGLPELSRYLFNRDGVCVAQRANQPPSTELLANLRRLSARPRAYVVNGVSYLPHLARGKLLVVGGGHVGQRVADLASSVDFEVTVVDDRAEYVTEERFPNCVQRIAGKIDEVLPALVVDEDTFLYRGDTRAQSR